MELNGKHITKVEFTVFRTYPQIHIHTGDNEIHSVDPMAIASWMELLGYAEPQEALEAILEAAIKRAEPEPDWDDNGTNVWTEAYTLLQHREAVREAEAFRAMEEGTRDDPRSPKLRSTLAAYRAVHEPVDGGECVMDRCRRKARDTMGLPEPSRKCGPTNRISLRASMAPMVASAEEPDEDKRKLGEVIEQCKSLISPNTQAFLHQLAGNAKDPFVEPEPEPDPDEPLRDIFKKYGGQG